MEGERILEVYKDYFWEFYDPLPEKVKEKIDYVFEIIISAERVPKKFLKHLDDGIYEMRLE